MVRITEILDIANSLKFGMKLNIESNQFFARFGANFIRFRDKNETKKNVLLILLLLHRQELLLFSCFFFFILDLMDI